jgi:hypothetical protein
MLDQRLRANKLGARLDQRCFQCIGVVRKVISSLSHRCDPSTIALIRAINCTP